MGNGMQSGGLAGGAVSAANLAPAIGQSAVLSSNLGAGASDIVTKIGSTLPDASVNASATLAAIRTGIGGTEVTYWAVMKNGTVTQSGLLAMSNGTGGAIAWGTNNYLYGLDINASLNLRQGSAGTDRISFFANSGRIDQSGTDSTGAPGNATIDKPTGKSAIAAGASTVTITSNQVAATSIILITPHARDATCKEIIAVPGAGSFVVSGSANATAAVPFSWTVQNIL